METNIPDPNPALASLDDTSSALSAVRNLVTGGRNAGSLRAMFNGPLVEPKRADTTVDRAKDSLQRAPRKPALLTPSA